MLERIEVGHWEGDLIVGNRSTAMATLVERVIRFTILVPLPGARTMLALNAAVGAVFSAVPDHVPDRWRGIRAKRSPGTLSWPRARG